ncbi:DNA polymerase-3 subunit epsilon, partial [Nitrosospira multiformis]
TADNEAGLDDVPGIRSSMKFDLDTYKLLLKTLGKQTEVITFG